MITPFEEGSDKFIDKSNSVVFVISFTSGVSGEPEVIFCPCNPELFPSKV